MILSGNNKTLSQLTHAHLGRAAIVFGGAPCLIADLKAIEGAEVLERAVILSANQHALVNGLKRPEEVDYIVACDDKIVPTIKPYGRPIIAPRPWADFRVLHQHVSNSGALACVAAWAMGCAPIVVIGVELYEAETYWHSPQARSTGKTIPVEMHLRRWSVLTEKTPRSMIRAVSGPLLKIFKAFDRREPTQPVAQAAEIRALIAGKRVEIVKDCPSWHGMRLKAGEVMEVKPSEQGVLITDGYARRLPA